MTYRKIKSVWIMAVLAFVMQAGTAIAQSDPELSSSDLGVPISKELDRPSVPSVEVSEPRRFVTTHQMEVGGETLKYTAIAGETYIYSSSGDPIGSIFSFSYIKQGEVKKDRPVVFVFNGGPGSSSIWLHLGVIGPKRLVLDQEVNPSNVPPFGLDDNPYTILEVADLVFIDPVGTGWSRPVGSGTSADFWGINEDADTVSQFIELWLTEHGRWNSAKYLLGESYGSTRAALLPRALMGGPLYVGRMRGITINGIILLGTTVEPRDAHGIPRPDLKEALELPAIVDTAWYHNSIDRAGRSLEQVHQEAYEFAISEYAEAIELEKSGQLPREARNKIVTRLEALSGIPASKFEETIEISVRGYAKALLAADGLEVGIYDSRYTLPLENSGNDPVADDPAMGRYVPGFIAAFHQMAQEHLAIRMERPYGAIVWKDLLPNWNWKRDPIPQEQSFARDLTIAMRRNPEMEVLVASGYFDLATNSASAEYSIKQANPPDERIAFKRYESGHMLYLGDTAEAFSNDIKALIRRTSN